MLTLAELHIVQLAIVDARETGTGLSTNQPLRIDAMRYAEVFNTTRQNAYQRMKALKIPCLIVGLVILILKEN